MNTLRAAVDFVTKTVTTLALLAPLAILAYAGTQPQAIASDAELYETRDHLANSPVGVYEAHRATCWRGLEEPKAAYPGAAIIHLESGEAKYVTGMRVVDAAFNEALGVHDDARFEVVALCV